MQVLKMQNKKNNKNKHFLTIYFLKKNSTISKITHHTQNHTHHTTK